MSLRYVYIPTGVGHKSCAVFSISIFNLSVSIACMPNTRIGSRAPETHHTHARTNICFVCILCFIHYECALRLFTHNIGAVLSNRRIQYLYDRGTYLFSYVFRTTYSSTISIMNVATRPSAALGCVADAWMQIIRRRCECDDSRRRILCVAT